MKIDTLNVLVVLYWQLHSLYVYRSYHLSRAHLIYIQCPVASLCRFAKTQGGIVHCTGLCRIRIAIYQKKNKRKKF